MHRFNRFRTVSMPNHWTDSNRSARSTAHATIWTAWSSSHSATSSSAKGLTTFCRVAQQTDFDFAWFGTVDDGPHASSTVKRWTENPPDNVTFSGWVEDKRGAFAAGDVFCFPAKVENQGIVVLEAMACGKAVVLRDIPVFDEFFTHGVDCLKCETEDEFRRALELLHRDPELRERLGENGRKTAAKHSLERVGEELVEIYSKMRLKSQALNTPSSNGRLMSRWVAAFTDTYLPTINGVTYTIRTWRDFWEKTGGRMDVVYPQSDGYTPEKGEHPIGSLQFPFYEGYRLGTPRIPKAVIDAEIVHSHTPFTIGVGGLRLARKHDLPFVTSYHTPTGEYADYLVSKRLRRGLRRTGRGCLRTVVLRALGRGPDAERGDEETRRRDGRR